MIRPVPSHASGELYIPSLTSAFSVRRTFCPLMSRWITWWAWRWVNPYAENHEITKRDEITSECMTNAERNCFEWQLLCSLACGGEKKFATAHTSWVDERVWCSSSLSDGPLLSDGKYITNRAPLVISLNSGNAASYTQLVVFLKVLIQGLSSMALGSIQIVRPHWAMDSDIVNLLK